jgi:WD40 repeat protein
MLKGPIHRTLPLVSNPCAPYGAQGLDSSILIWHRNRLQPVDRFMNAFQTPISVVDWSHDGHILLAGSITGEVLAWQFATGGRLLANRSAHSYAPIMGISWSPGGYYLVALTRERTIQVWQVATRECIALLPCHECTTVRWSLDGSRFTTNDGISFPFRPGDTI